MDTAVILFGFVVLVPGVGEVEGPENPANSSICLQRKRGCSDVGRLLLATVAAALQRGRDAVWPVYICISLYLYIYMLFFSFPVSHQ